MQFLPATHLCDRIPESELQEKAYDQKHWYPDRVDRAAMAGWVPGYQSIARYDQDTDTVVVQFVNSTGGDTEAVIYIIYNRIVRILNR